jgi:hypothetical protein
MPSHTSWVVVDYVSIIPDFREKSREKIVNGTKGLYSVKYNPLVI